MFKVEVGDKTLLLLADLAMEAELVALIYRYRWQVELPFKRFKNILGCRHLVADSRGGVAIQICSALIAALMLQLLTGKRATKRATKRAMEFIRLLRDGLCGARRSHQDVRSPVARAWHARISRYGRKAGHRGSSRTVLPGSITGLRVDESLRLDFPWRLGDLTACL